MFLQRPKKTPREDEARVFAIGSFTFDAANQLLAFGEDEKELTLREAELLTFFIRNKNRVLEREDILDAVWKNSDFFISRSLDVFVSRLRKHLRADPAISIESVHGIGFKFKCP